MSKADERRIAQAMDKLDAGEKLTAREQQALEAALARQGAEQAYQAQVERWRDES